MEIFLMTSFTQPKSLEVFSGNKARRPYQTLSISNNKHVANIDMNDGWNSWNLVWDEETGYLATRIFSKKVCFVSKMRKNTVPDTALFPQLIKERKSAGLEAPPAKEVLCLVSETTASDLASFGQSIQAQCKGVPTYIAHHLWILFMCTNCTVRHPQSDFKTCTKQRVILLDHYQACFTSMLVQCCTPVIESVSALLHQSKFSVSGQLFFVECY
uniref:Gastrokine 1 n=1 Tax=Crocodylus porosus TaxID=8502 RepID=A0A7M4FG71_CROPO